MKLKKQFRLEFMYILFKIKFNVFKKYLNTNLKKKFIIKFKLSTEYSIFFTLNKTTNFVYALIIKSWTILRSKINIHYSILINFKINCKKLNFSSKLIYVKHTIWFALKKNKKQFSKFDMNIMNIWLCRSNLRTLW